MTRGLVLLAILLGATAAHAQLYRWTDSQGKVHVTDTPPPPGAKGVVKQNPPAVKPEPAEPFALAAARKRYPITLYTGTDCKPCDGARNLLNARGVPFTEKLIVTTDEAEELAKVANTNSVPVMVIGSTVQQGFAEDQYHALLDTAGYPKTGVLPPRTQAAAEPPKPEVKPVAQDETAPRGPYADRPPSVPQPDIPAPYKPGAPPQRAQKK